MKYLYNDICSTDSLKHQFVQVTDQHILLCIPKNGNSTIVNSSFKYHGLPFVSKPSINIFWYNFSRVRLDTIGTKGKIVIGVYRDVQERILSGKDYSYIESSAPRFKRPLMGKNQTYDEYFDRLVESFNIFTTNKLNRHIRPQTWFFDNWNIDYWIDCKSIHKLFDRIGAYYCANINVTHKGEANIVVPDNVLELYKDDIDFISSLYDQVDEIPLHP